MRNLRTVFLALACLALASCVVSPPSRTAAESNLSVTLQGFALGNALPIKVQAVNQNNGSVDTLGMATFVGPGIPHTTSGGTMYTLFPWTFTTGVLDKKYWSPQDIIDELKTAQGHLELFASNGGKNFATFSPGASAAAMAAGGDPNVNGLGFSDGTATVLFDQTGVNEVPEGPWVNVQGMTMMPPAGGYPAVAWSVGYYTVEGGKKIYGLICTPVSGGPYPVVIYNHGGFDKTNGGNVSGLVTAAGWTDVPPPPMGQMYSPPDGLGQCVDWAKRGWVFATSAYRGENVNIASMNAAFPAGTWTSQGAVEFCMGEVTDVMALTDLVANHAADIAVGAVGHTVKPKVSGKLLMYGYSHGGCNTWRAVEQGAPVTAVSVIEGFTDLRLGYLTSRSNGASADLAAALSGAIQPGSVTPYQPDLAGVMGYNWRSAHYFAARGDLSIQKFKAMPILIFHGDVDNDVLGYNPVPLNQPALIAADIRATNIFVGPTGMAAPTSVSCISVPAGAPVAALAGPDTTCPISLTLMDTGDPCVANGMPFPTLCAALPLPLPSQPQQQHYFVVYHNMDHVDGGFAIKSTFNSFVLHNFGRVAGCDGLVPGCAND